MAVQLLKPSLYSTKTFLHLNRNSIETVLSGNGKLYPSFSGVESLSFLHISKHVVSLLPDFDILFRDFSEEDIFVFPNASLLSLFSLISYLHLNYSKFSSKILSIKLFTGNLGFPGAPNLSRFLREMLLRDLQELNQSPNLSISVLCPNQQFSSIRNSQDPNNLCFYETIHNPQQLSFTNYTFSRISSSLSTSISAKFLIFGRPHPQKNNFQSFLRFCHLFLQHGFTGLIHFDKQTIRSLNPSTSQELQLAVSQGLVKLVIYDDLVGNRWFDAISSLNCLVSFSNGSYFSSTLGCSNRVRECLLMGIPIITDPDSVFELSIQTRPLALVHPPFISLSLLPSRKYEFKLTAQHSSRVKHFLCGINYVIPSGAQISFLFSLRPHSIRILLFSQTFDCRYSVTLKIPSTLLQNLLYLIGSGFDLTRFPRSFGK